jgi:hypothetical protein
VRFWGSSRRHMHHFGLITEIDRHRTLFTGKLFEGSSDGTTCVVGLYPHIIRYLVADLQQLG